MGLTEVYSHEDPDAKPILEKVAKYTKQAEVMKMPYWVFAEGSSPIGIVAVGKEPVQLLAPSGTPMGMLYLVDTKQPEEKMRSFIERALALASERDVAYALAFVPLEEKQAIDALADAAFQELDDAHVMVCPLGEKEFEPSSELQFHMVQREEVPELVELFSRFYRGSTDAMAAIALGNLRGVPEEFLDFYYGMERFYMAKKDDETIGIVDFNPETGQISNVGVDKRHRGKGYGKQIMLFALRQLKESGCEQARLRVHVRNEPAVRLYEKLGFDKVARYKTLIRYFSDEIRRSHMAHLP